MILTELKETVYSFERQGNEYHQIARFCKSSDDKVSGHCSRRNGCYGFACSKMGMRVMIDFHYSDSWADPGKQFKPAAWKITLFQNY
jgi:arabinogalactan endo-1,4-beta-galactosidase